MSAQLGNKQKAYICSGADDITTVSDAIWIGCETSNNANRTQEAVECSDKSSNWAKFLSAKRAGTFEVTAYADNGDAGQVEALKGIHVNDKVHFAIAVSGADDWDDMEYGDCIVTAISDTNDFGAVATRTISLQATGPLNHYPEWEEEEVEEAPEESAEEPGEETPEQPVEEQPEDVVEEPAEVPVEEQPSEEEPGPAEETE